MKYLLLFTTLIFAAELEVDGDLKVTGTVDASGNPITNVGVALSMTDAINGNMLQSALRDDGVYEYKLYIVILNYSDYSSDMKYQEYVAGQTPSGSVSDFLTGFHNILFSLLNNGWKIDHTISLTVGNASTSSSDDNNKTLYIFKRPIADD